MNNPLRYPGAKSKLYKYISDLLISEELKGCTFYEPYGGSAALSFKLLENCIIDKAVINEKDPLIYSFWYCVFNRTDELIQRINDVDISIDTWNEFSNFKNEDFIKGKDIIDIGFAGLFLNRTSFSGILKAGPLGGNTQSSSYTIDCRFNKQSIIKNIIDCSKYKRKISIYNLDAIHFMKRIIKFRKNSKIFVYIDPPYYEKGKSLYRYYYNDKNHTALYEYIKNKVFPWLISYDDHPFIENLYCNKNKVKLYLDYSVRTSKKGRELLISNLEIPPIEENKTFKLNLKSC